MAVIHSTQEVLFGPVRKCCCVCGEAKPLADFSPDKRKRHKVAHRCKACSNTMARDYRKKNPEMRRGIHLLNRYGITRDEYDALFAKQGGVCAICGRPETAGNYRCVGVCNLAVDHDHDTGAVRGLLCKACNNGIGHFKDDAKVMEAAAAYIRSHQTSSGEKPA